MPDTLRERIAQQLSSDGYYHHGIMDSIMPLVDREIREVREKALAEDDEQIVVLLEQINKLQDSLLRRNSNGEQRA